MLPLKKKKVDNYLAQNFDVTTSDLGTITPNMASLLFLFS